MSLFRRSAPTQLASLIPTRSSRPGLPPVDKRDAMCRSVVWSAWKLRSSLVSMMPIDVLTRQGDLTFTRPTPPVLVSPSSYGPGQPQPIGEWLYASQMALESCGNNIGFVSAYTALGFPAQIDLIPDNEIQITISDHRIKQYRFNGEVVDPFQVWHERDNVLPGLPVGLSPITYAALAIAGSQAASKFAADWFVNGHIPSAVLKNVEKAIPNKADKLALKQAFRETVESGDIFPIGKDWEYTPVQAKALDAAFVAIMNYSDVELLRFFNMDADMVDVAVQGGSTINYANITQRMLHFLTKRMNSTLTAREWAFTTLTPKTWFVKLNRSAMLAMDDLGRAELNDLLIRSRQRTPSEARLKDDKQPFTEEQLAEFDRLFGNPNKQIPQKGTGA